MKRPSTANRPTRSSSSRSRRNSRRPRRRPTRFPKSSSARPGRAVAGRRRACSKRRRRARREPLAPSWGARSCAGCSARSSAAAAAVDRRSAQSMSAAGYRGWGIAFAVVGVLAFSLRPILIKLSYASHPVSPNTLLFLRMTLSLPFFLAVGWWLRRDEPRLGGRDWAAVMGLGFLGYYGASFLDFLGLQWVGAGTGRLILFLFPTLVLLLSFLFLHKAPTRPAIAALLLSYAGIALVVSNQVGGGAEGRLFLFGALLVFASALLYAVYLVAGSQVVKRVGSMRFTAYSMAVATLPAVVQFFLLESTASLQLPANVWVYAIVLATLSTVLPVFLQAEALRRIGANHFALIGAVGPVSVAITSALGLDEPFTWVQAVGGMLVISGVLLVSLKRS